VSSAKVSTLQNKKYVMGKFHLGNLGIEATQINPARKNRKHICTSIYIYIIYIYYNYIYI